MCPGNRCSGAGRGRRKKGGQPWLIWRTGARTPENGEARSPDPQPHERGPQERGQLGTPSTVAQEHLVIAVNLAKLTPNSTELVRLAQPVTDRFRPFPRLAPLDSLDFAPPFLLQIPHLGGRACSISRSAGLAPSCSWCADLINLTFLPPSPSWLEPVSQSRSA